MLHPVRELAASKVVFLPSREEHTIMTPTLSVERRTAGVFSGAEQQALLGFLGGYSGLTRDAYALDLRQFAAWCQQRQLALFDVARHAIEGDPHGRTAPRIDPAGEPRAVGGTTRGPCGSSLPIPAGALWLSATREWGPSSSALRAAEPVCRYGRRRSP